MAWIKIETGTPDKPELRAAARTCRTTPASAFLAFFRLWSYFDEHSEDGHIAGFAPQDADEIARLPGFGNALGSAGWLVFDNHGVTIANWDRHNGKSAKRRAIDTERKRLERARTACGHFADKSRTRS